MTDHHLTVGFLGGSITEDGESNWPGPVARWLAATFPDTRIQVENAGLGATGSNSACLRARREIIETGCDLCFVEYAVNDQSVPTELRRRSREGLLRQLLASDMDVVLVYTFCQGMYADMIAGRVPPSVAEFELLAEHYGISSIWVGAKALREVCTGGMLWGEWLPDGLHPTHRGSWSYAEAVIDFLREELLSTSPSSPSPSRLLRTALDPLHWQRARLISLDSVSTEGPWLQRRVHNRLHTGQVLETHTPGATLRFSFEGRGLVLIFEYGRRSAEIRYRLDGGEWTTTSRERYEWGGDREMVQPLVIADDLADAPHTFEFTVVHGDRAECTGTECRLALIGIL